MSQGNKPAFVIVDTDKVELKGWPSSRWDAVCDKIAELEAGKAIVISVPTGLTLRQYQRNVVRALWCRGHKGMYHVRCTKDDKVAVTKREKPNEPR